MVKIAKCIISPKLYSAQIFMLNRAGGCRRRMRQAPFLRRFGTLECRGVSALFLRGNRAGAEPSRYEKGAALDEYDATEAWDLPRMAPRGRTFVYVLPCVGEDLAKVGFTHDPVQRFRSFHARFFSLFDLQQGLLVETGLLRDARRLERLLIERWPQHRATPPLLVADAAGGHTEWFRGIGEELGPFVRRVADRYGYTVHAPLSEWLRARFAERADRLYEWSERVLDMIQWQAANLPPEAHDPRYARALVETLDACHAVGLALADLVPSRVLAWYAEGSGERATTLF